MNSSHAMASATITAAIPPASHRMPRGQAAQGFNTGKTLREGACARSPV